MSGPSVPHLAKVPLPERGLGWADIRRPLEEWPETGLVDDREGRLCTTVVRRPAAVVVAPGDARPEPGKPEGSRPRVL